MKLMNGGIHEVHGFENSMTLSGSSQNLTCKFNPVLIQMLLHVHACACEQTAHMNEPSAKNN